MVYAIGAQPLEKINLQPSTVAEEVVQNVTMILNTLEGTCPLFREFGLNTEFIDKPEPAARQMIVQEIYDKIEAYEPRAEIVSVSFLETDRPGHLRPLVEVEIND